MNFPIKEIGFEDFPPLLKEINDPPEKLWVQGIVSDNSYKFLCVVGSRKYTPYGKDVCEKLIDGLRGHKVVVVSGLALGIDSIAHRAALRAGLKTIAVPGSGLDEKVLYPGSNRGLAHNILEAGGTLLSPFENNFRATQWSFPARNRIMAGLSHATLVIEAETKSGTLITARLAADYNRDVLVVPGSIFSPTSAGPHMLMRLGAIPITSSKDILDALEIRSEETEKSERNYTDCNETELKIVEVLKTSPLSRDELIEKTDIDIREMNAALTLMEIKGLIKESVGKIHLL